MDAETSADPPFEAAPAWVPATPLEASARRLRASAAALIVAVALTIGWLAPQRWDLIALVGFALYLGVLLAACVFVFICAQLVADEPPSEILRVLKGEPLSLRDRTRFLNRLARECRKADLPSRSRGLAMIVVAAGGASAAGEAGATGEAGAVHNNWSSSLDLVRKAVRTRDVVGDVRPGELWVLAIDAGPQAAEALRLRLGAVLATRSGDGVSIGWSNFGIDAAEPDGLVRIARERASLPDAGGEEITLAA